MADFTARRPFEAEKHTELHDRASKPAAPAAGLTRYLPLAITVAVALGFVALAFETRASWDSHREWVVPVTLPLFVVGGVTLTDLLMRKAWLAALPACVLLAAALVLTASDWWRAAISEGDDGLRDGLTIATAVVLGVLLAYLIPAFILVEARAKRTGA